MFSPLKCPINMFFVLLISAEIIKQVKIVFILYFIYYPFLWRSTSSFNASFISSKRFLVFNNMGKRNHTKIP